MSRVQLALNVSDLEEAVTFYSKLFGTEPAKRRPGYANFAIADPPLKLVLMEDVAARGHGAPSGSLTQTLSWTAKQQVVRSWTSVSMPSLLRRPVAATTSSLVSTSTPRWLSAPPTP